jgi:hypothetical protein
MAADMKMLPWPRPSPTIDGVSITTWVMAFGRQLAPADADLAAERVRMQDPPLDVVVTLDGCQPQRRRVSRPC